MTQSTSAIHFRFDKEAFKNVGKDEEFKEVIVNQLTPVLITKRNKSENVETIQEVKLVLCKDDNSSEKRIKNSLKTLLMDVVNKK